MTACTPPSLTRSAPPSLTRSASLWFGLGASKSPLKAAAADVLSCCTGAAGVLTGAVALRTTMGTTREDDASLRLLYNLLIPCVSSGALVIALISLQSAIRFMLPVHGARFGRKSLLLSSACTVLFVCSCVYRSFNIADEGAAKCWSSPSAFNAPAAGRLVATIGELALAVQLSIFVELSAQRLGAERGLWRHVFEKWTNVPFTTIGPVLLAEAMSWSGVLSGNSKFFCLEYTLWIIVAVTWAWDAAELLHKARRLQDRVAFAYLLLVALALVSFNAFFEIPHFFAFSREVDDSRTGQQGVFECLQDSESPLWLKRLPFFLTYFCGAAWSSTAASYRLLRVVTASRINNKKVV